MAEKGEIKIISIITICLILFSIGFSGCVDSNTDKEELDFEINYKIDLKENKEITIFLPILIATNGKLPDLNNNLKIINGNPIYTIQDSIYGQVINITCNESFQIGIKSQDEDLLNINGESKSLDFTTRNGTQKSYFCYLETESNINENDIYVDILYIYHHYLPAPSSEEHSSGSDVTIKITGYLEKGWNELEGEIIKHAA